MDLRELSDRDLDRIWMVLGQQRDRLLRSTPTRKDDINRALDRLDEIEEEQRAVRRETWRRYERKSLGG